MINCQKPRAARAKNRFGIRFSMLLKSFAWKMEFKTSKNAAQVKEKWRNLFDRYKQVSDHNKQTGRDPKTFDGFDDIDEFMSSSDKVNPRFVKQTRVVGEIENDPENSGDEEDENIPLSRAVIADKGKRPAKRASASGDGEAQIVPNKKKKRASTDGTETELAILEMLRGQQEAMAKAEENDQRILETLMKSQSDAEERHNNFVVSVLQEVVPKSCQKRTSKR